MSPSEIVGAVSMTLGCALWGLTYLLIMRKARQDKAHGYPWIYTCAGFSYEFLQGFVLEPSGAGVVVPVQVAVMKLWFLVDLGLVIQLLMYGPALQKNEFIRRWFAPLTALGILGAGAVQYAAVHWLNDYSGHIVGFAVGVLGACAFVGLALKRPDNRGLSYPAAWLKLVATLLVSIPHAIAWPTISPEGPFAAMWAMYVLFTAGDVVYLTILRRQRTT